MKTTLLILLFLIPFGNAQANNLNSPKDSIVQHEAEGYYPYSFSNPHFGQIKWDISIYADGNFYIPCISFMNYLEQELDLIRSNVKYSGELKLRLEPDLSVTYIDFYSKNSPMIKKIGALKLATANYEFETFKKTKYSGVFGDCIATQGELMCFTNAPKDLKFYQSCELQFMGANTFIGQDNLQSFVVELEGNWQVRLLVKSERSFVRGLTNIKGSFIFNGLPLGQEIILIATMEKDGKCYYAIEETTVDSKNYTDFNIQEATLEEIIKIIGDLKL